MFEAIRNRPRTFESATVHDHQCSCVYWFRWKSFWVFVVNWNW